jgi:hypothetical protein
MPTSCVNKRTFGIAAALLILATVVAGLRLTTEPTFEGRSLSYWMDQLPSIDFGTGGRSESEQLPGWYKTTAEAVADEGRVRSNIQQAHKALDTIGTNHLSMLVARLQSKDSRAMTTVWVWADRLRIIDYSLIRSAQFRRGQALHAFAYLRTRARPVVPQLLDLTTNQNTNTQLLAWYALEAVAPDEFHKRKHPPIIQHVPR